MHEVEDQCGRRILIPEHPQRIVSLVPSQTELLYDLGMGNSLAGITRFCIHPALLKKNTAIVGGTKNLHITEIRNLKPDLIIANKEENEKSQIEELAKEFPVWISDISDLESALNMINALGKITNTLSKASLIIEDISDSFRNLEQFPKLNALYLIWKKPYMGVGNDTFIHDMLTRCNIQNVLKEYSRYPELSETEMKALNPDFVFLSSEPYPFKEKHIPEINSILPSTRVVLVDGEMFSWYGSRLQKSARYFGTLLNELHN